MSEQGTFRFMGLTAETLTLGYGVLLIAWGAIFSVGSESMTSWIPSMIGAPILISGALTRAMPDKRKIWMHKI